MTKFKHRNWSTILSLFLQSIRKKPIHLIKRGTLRPNKNKFIVLSYVMKFSLTHLKSTKNIGSVCGEYYKKIS